MVPMAEETANSPTPTLVYYSLSGPDALAVLRVLGPADFAGMKVIHGVENGGINVEAVSQGDIVVLQRDVCKYYDKYQQIIALAHAENKPVVFDLDDLLLELPEDHPDRISGFYTQSLLPMLQAIVEADLITVATESLKNELLPYNPHITVIPNYLNDSLWRFRTQGQTESQVGTIKIGYMGGKSHAPDLEAIVPALNEILKKYPGRVKLTFWGIDPPDELIPWSETAWNPPDSYEYSAFSAYFKSQSVDAAIAPLNHNKFNSCKSPIKYFEYTANAFPCVYSNLNPYSDVIVDGKNGFLAETIEEWVSKLSRLIDNPDLRAHIVQNAQADIEENWLLSKNYQRQLQVYKDLVITRKPTLKVEPINLDLIRSLASQFHESFQSHDRQIVSLQSAQAESQRKIEAFVETIGDISRSRDDLLREIDRVSQLNEQQTVQLIQKQDEILSLSERMREKENILDSLTLRINEIESEKGLLNTTIEGQQATIQRLTEQNTELNVEAASYVNSKSWKYTRPFRRAISLIRKVFHK